MLFDRLTNKLEGLGKASMNGHKVRGLYKIICQPEIWQEAYARIYSNKGAMTKGSNDNTLDGMSFQRIDSIIKSLKEETYQPTPVRRIYIPKRSGKLRPLGIPSGDDKLVQEVVRIILERIYEPVFLDTSHGFRTGRSCHTALKQIQKTWTGIKWFIEFDIKGFFDNMKHDIMIQLLEKKIDDERFINLIKAFLKAGYFEDWKYHKTHSGTPQGGIVSPILSNIYLHELDEFIQELTNQFTVGKKRPANPEYRKLCNLKTKIRKEIKRIGQQPELVERLEEANQRQKEIPSGDTHSNSFKRLKYCRYADDFIIGIIGSKDEAQEIKSNVVDFLDKGLALQVAEDKTRIASGTEGIKFLSYEISTQRNDSITKTQVKGTYSTRRVINESIKLSVPPEKVIAFNDTYGYGDWQSNEPKHRAELLRGSDVEIIETYNAELRGLANYYNLAGNMKKQLGKIQYLSQYSLFKTLSGKHKCSITQTITRLSRGNEFAHRYQKEERVSEIKIFQLKHMDKSPKYMEDEIPKTLFLTASGSELIRRMNAKECEHCRQTDLPTEVHHVHKLKDLKSKPHLENWEKIMIARNRKTLILCTECHNLLGAGKLSDNRYRPKNI
jgi:RNA-directed DNA polymerase